MIERKKRENEWEMRWEVAEGPKVWETGIKGKQKLGMRGWGGSTRRSRAE